MIYLYQAYGRQDIIDQVKLSIVSLCQFLSADDLVAIYTDQSEQLGQFFDGESRVIIVPIDLEIIKAWRGAIDFVHRVKLEAILDCMKRFSQKMIYMDGDTVFTSDPRELASSISDKHFLMHINEGKLNEERDPLAKKIHRFVKGKKFQIPSGEFQIDGNTEMWNAGVIGIGEHSREVIEKALEMTDVLYAGYPKHTMEQLAVSFCLQTKGTISPAESCILHYWDQKDQVIPWLAKFFAENNSFEEAIVTYVGLKEYPWSTPRPTKRKGFLSFFWRS